MVLLGAFGIAIATVLLGFSRTLAGVLIARVLGKCLAITVLRQHFDAGICSWSILWQCSRYAFGPRRINGLDESGHSLSNFWIVLACGCYRWVIYNYSLRSGNLLIIELLL